MSNYQRIPPLPTRRHLLVAGAALAVAGPALAAGGEAEAALADLERQHGGRLGVFALDTGSGRNLAHRADERFLMCSTFKTLAVAAILARVDAGHERLARRIAYGPKDLLEYAPVTRVHVKEGALTLEALCAAAIEVSDNTAANLILAILGGPGAVTRYARGLGDRITRLDRNEPTANRANGARDTTSPRAMTGSVRRLLLGDALSPASRARLEGWMTTSTPGLTRIRAGLPAGWRVGDKAGTGDTETNDVVIARPPGRAPILIAAYYAAPKGEAVLREVGAIVAGWAG
jgi:beta-lactamase class A